MTREVFLQSISTKSLPQLHTQVTKHSHTNILDYLSIVISQYMITQFVVEQMVSPVESEPLSPKISEPESEALDSARGKVRGIRTKR